MARLSVFHMLCPLIDQVSFLGVANDSQDDCVIVTLGRNIVIRYKIVDRKQVGSWSTREKLTSPVIYDPIGSQYVAVFNRNQIRTWKEEDENLDSVKKHKFPEEIQCILRCGDRKKEPIVLLQSGRVCWLSRFLGGKEKLLEIWKQQERSGMNIVLKSDETLEEWHTISCQTEAYILLSARSSNFMKQIRFYLLRLSSDEEEEYQIIKQFTLKLPDSYLLGHTVVQQCDQSCLVTLWSSGKIYILSLIGHKNLKSGGNIKSKMLLPTEEEIDSPGRLIDSVKGLLNVENVIAMAALGSDHIALYGAEPSSEGGVVYVVDIHSSTTGDLPWEALKESAAKQSLACFNAKDVPPRIWEAAGYLFVPSSDGRLLLSSYELGPHPPLADLLGCLWKHSSSKKMVNNNNNGVINHNQLQCVVWLPGEKSSKNHSICSSSIKNQQVEGGKPSSAEREIMPEKVSSKLKPLIKQGLPESSICSIIFPSLMKEGDVESISWCLSHFHDIPETNLVELLCFFLNQKPVKTTPKKVEEISSIAPEDKSVNAPTWSKISKEKTSELPPVKEMMNGDIHEHMDTNDFISHDEDSEMESFEVGHTFVKGRRRSLRVMKVNTPQKNVSISSVNNSMRKVGKLECDDMQQLSHMEVDRCSSPTVYASKKRERRNSSQVLTRLEIVKKGMETDGLSSGEFDGVIEDRSSDSGIGYQKSCDSRTQPDCSVAKRTGLSSGLTEQEMKFGSLALPVEQLGQVGLILSVPVSSMILPQLRQRLPFPSALKLLKHLLWLLYSPLPSVPSSPSEIQVIHWICHILDAFYQRFTLSQDLEVKEILEAVKEVLDIQLQLIDSLKEIAPVIIQLQSGKKIKENICDKWYSIENIQLF
ncbi:uncharacterized protein LOC124166679 [Ischnura elegans]|uniref:uncharacterized protein LOC124166679 n=1 Tax=Ischnura elegans TaxID=197161 RepID=UPI001ED889E3|nr:uncharacterized protein LOC124166679 [Ischnura elegans]